MQERWTIRVGEDEFKQSDQRVESVLGDLYHVSMEFTY